MTPDPHVEFDLPARQSLGKVRYSHQDMIDFILAHPGVKQNDIAFRYGYSAAWVSLVMSSDAFQSAFAARRTEMVDPTLAATIEERFRGVLNQSLVRLAGELEKPTCKPEVMLKAAELGAKALGMGGAAPPPPPPRPEDHLAALAHRLIDLQSHARQGAINGQAIQVPHVQD